MEQPVILRGSKIFLKTMTRNKRYLAIKNSLLNFCATDKLGMLLTSSIYKKRANSCNMNFSNMAALVPADD